MWSTLWLLQGQSAAHAAGFKVGVAEPDELGSLSVCTQIMTAGHENR